MTIREWQETVLPNQNSEEVISIAKVFSDCSDLWGLVTDTLTEQHLTKKNTIRKLESAHSYIRLWADGYGILSGQFEGKLKNSQRAGDLTIRLLQSICRTLTQELVPTITKISTVASQDATSLSLTAADLALSCERLAVLVQGDNDSDASEDDDPVAPSGSVSYEKLLDDIADDLRNDTQCLLDLGTRFEEQLLNPIASEAAANPLNSFNGGLSDTFIERIIRLYPQCESNLAGRMGNANWLRFVRIAELKPRTSEGRPTQDKDTDTVYDATESEPIDFQSVVDTASTRGKSLFHDSGLGTASHASESRPNAVRLAPERQSYPPLPESATQGEPFRCMTCKNQVTVVSEKEWRTHLLSDIEPYICPEPDCDAPLFANTSQWRKHVDSSHPQSTIWSDSRCRICGKATQNRVIVLWHLINHMEDIALAIIPRDPAVEVGKVRVNNTDEESKIPTFSSKQEHKKRLRTKLRGVRTGCNNCKQRRIKCDEKRPSCTQCTRSKKLCAGYPPPPRSQEEGSVELPLPPAQTHESESESESKSTALDEHWFSLFLENSMTSLAEDDLLELLFDDTFTDLPLPAEARRFLLDSTNITQPRTGRDDGSSPALEDFMTTTTTKTTSYDPVADRQMIQAAAKLTWDNQWRNDTSSDFSGQDSYPPSLFFPSGESSATVSDATRINHQPGDAKRITGPSYDVLSRRRDKPLPPIIVEDPGDTLSMKRARNTLAARKSREQKARRLEELEEKIAKLEQERDNWKNVAMKHGAGHGRHT
ncbi:hypothetical protein F4678DRAFT_434454 [Xylaria arbuscula]|nr:hypothetical protein F4678DRAFT_434454 [Xylaria arbuscula]